MLQGVRRLVWLLTAQVKPEPASETTKPNAGLATTLTQGAGGSRRCGRRRMMAGHRPVAAGLRRRRALHQHAVLAAVGREAAQAVGEERPSGGATGSSCQPPGSRVAAQAGGQGRVALGPVELAGQRAAVADQHDPRRRLEQDVLVLGHLRRLAHEDAAGLVDPLGRAARRGRRRAICRFSSSR